MSIKPTHRLVCSAGCKQLHSLTYISVWYEVRRRSLFHTDTGLFALFRRGPLAAAACSRVARWIHSSVVFIKTADEQTMADLPGGHRRSRDLLALKHSEAHTLMYALKHTQTPEGVMPLVRANPKGLETQFKLLIVRRVRETELIIVPLKKKRRCALYFRKMFLPQRKLLVFHFLFSLSW